MRHIIKPLNLAVITALTAAAAVLPASAAPPTPSVTGHATSLPGVSIDWVQPASPAKSLQEWKDRPPAVVQERDLISTKGDPKPVRGRGGEWVLSAVVKFTAEEIRKMAVQAGRYRCAKPTVTGTGASRCTGAFEEVQVRVPDYAHVTVGRHTAMPQAQQKSRAKVLARWVPLQRYVDEVNTVEGFLHRFGRSLREKGGEDMGIVARLRQPSEHPHQQPPAPVPGFDTHIVGVPAQLSQDFLQPVKDVDVLAMQLRLAAELKDARMRSSLVARLTAMKPSWISTLQLRRLVAAGIGPKELMQAGAPSGRAVLFEQPKSFDCPAGTAPKPPAPANSLPQPSIPDFLNSKDWYGHVTEYFVQKNAAIASSMSQRPSGVPNDCSIFDGDCNSDDEKDHANKAVDNARAAGLRLINRDAGADITAATDVISGSVWPFRCDDVTETCVTLYDTRQPPVNLNEEIPPRGAFETLIWNSQSMCKVFLGWQTTGAAPPAGPSPGGPSSPDTQLSPNCHATDPQFLHVQNILENKAGGSGFGGTSPPPDAPDAAQKKIDCLYDGTLDHQDYPHIGGSTMGGDIGLFGAHLQVGAGASSETCFGGTRQNFYDWVGANFDLTVFGANLSVLDFSDDACGPAGCSGAVGAKYTFLGEDFSSRLRFENTVDGPGGIVMIGPVPLHIGTRFHYRFGVEPSATGAAWNAPSAPHVQGATCPAAGSVLAQLPIGAEADAGFEAALDLLIVSAGVDAHIQFIDTQFSANMETDVEPGANEVAFRPALDLDTNMLGGWLDAFVEVDLLLYSKRWTLELFRYDGFSAHEHDAADIPPEFAK